MLKINVIRGMNCNFPAISGPKFDRKSADENPALNVNFSQSGHSPLPVGRGTCGVRDWAGSILAPSGGKVLVGHVDVFG